MIKPMRRIHFGNYMIEINAYSFDLAMRRKRKKPKPNQDKYYYTHQGFFTNIQQLLEKIMLLEGMNGNNDVEFGEYFKRWTEKVEEFIEIMNEYRNELRLKH